MTSSRMAGFRSALLISIALVCSATLVAQQQGQYQPGEYGLNAGVLPDPGITYADFNFNYNDGRLNFAAGDPVNAIGACNVWAISNIFFYVPKFKILKAKFGPFVAFPAIATGSLTLPFVGPPPGTAIWFGAMYTFRILTPVAN